MPDIHPELEQSTDGPANRPPISALTVESARRVLDERSRPTGEQEPVHDVYDRTIPGPRAGVPIRVYDDGHASSTDAPVLIWLHSGGFFHGTLDSEDPVCRAVATASDFLVVSVEYRLAPEHPFPAALNDCVAALEWVVENAGSIGGDADRIAVGGHSAGGNLAAATALMDRDFGMDAIGGQLLAYPGLNPYPFPFAEPFGSYEEPEKERTLTVDGMAWARKHYIADPIDARNPYAFPLQATDFGRLPPAEIVTAGFDPLCDDGAAYAERLQAAGCDVDHAHHERMTHGFFRAHHVPDVRSAMARALRDLQDSIVGG